MNFKEAMQAQHGELDVELVPDGKPHPFHAKGDRLGQNSGWYVLFHDGHGCWGSPYSNGSGVWHGPGLPAYFSPVEGWE